MKKIKFWAIINEQHSGTKSIDQEIRLFEKETKIKVELTEFPWRKIWDNIINSIKEDNKPDVVQIGSSWTSLLSEIGYLEDISPLLYSKDHSQGFYSIAPHINRKYFSVPWILDLSLFFIRKGKETEGVNLRTVADLYQLCGNLKIKSPFSIGSNKDTILIQYLSSFLWAHGGSFIENNRIDLLSQVNFTGIKAFFDLVQQTGIPSQLLNIYGDVLWNFFLEGKGLFTLANAWVIKAFIKPYHNEDKFQAMVIPGDKFQTPFMGGSCLGIIKGSKMFKESMEWVRFLMSFDSQKRYISKIGALPVRKDVLNRVIGDYVYKDAILDTLKLAHAYPATPYWGSFEKILLEFINDIFLDIANRNYNDKRLKEALKKVDQKIDMVIQLWER
jgi:ABC-type glycerol-3-phosphate transport system substrate-binding protein